MPAAIFMEGSLVLSTNFVVAADSSSDVADASTGFASTLASVADVVWDSVALVNTAVGADSLGMLKFLGDSFAEVVDTAVCWIPWGCWSSQGILLPWRIGLLL